LALPLWFLSGFLDRRFGRFFARFRAVLQLDRRGGDAGILAERRLQAGRPCFFRRTATGSRNEGRGIPFGFGGSVSDEMRSAHPVPSNDFGTRILCCFAITLAVVAFFWLYDAVVHRETLYVPQIERTASSGPSDRGDGRLGTLVPDMNSAAVKFASSDVPAPSTIPKPAESKSPENPKMAAPAKRKQHRVARAPSNPARFNNYAQSNPSWPAFAMGNVLDGTVCCDTR
jgi:hypothetical protein